METVAKRQRALLAQPPAPPPTEADAADAVAAVFSNVDLLREILLFLDSPKDLIRAALVSTRWFGAAADPAFLRRFRARCPPALLGFFATFGLGPIIIWPPAAPQPQLDVVRFVPLPHPPELDGGARLVGAALNGGAPTDLVLGCRNGRVLVKHAGHHGKKYSVRSPLRSTSVAVARAIRRPSSFPPRRDRELIKHGVPFVQVGLLSFPGAGDPRDAVALSAFGGTIMMPSRFDSTMEKFVQQVVYVRRQTREWTTHVSPPLELPVPVVFSREPCSLLVGGRWLCMTTVLGCIIVFDLATATFSVVVSFPDGVTVSCLGIVDIDILDHTLARAGDSGIYLVHAKGVELHVWFRRMDGDAAGIWARVETVYLPKLFGDLVAMKIWDTILSRNENDTNLASRSYFWVMASVEIHEVGDDAGFVFLTVEKLGPVFLLDVKKKKVEKVLQSEQDDDGRRLCGISAFMMPWPPVFPALNQRG